MKRARLAVGYAKDYYWLATVLPAGMWWVGNGWERRSHIFLHYSNVTWRFRFFISISTCSAWSSI